MINLHQLALPALALAPDEIKLIIFVVFCALLLFGSRFLFGRARAGEPVAGDFTQMGYTSPNQLTEARPEVHPEMRFEDITLRKFFFSQIDALAGPPDPFEFADELTVEVEHNTTGHQSKWEFTVGTPAGFARLLEKKEWESFYSPQTFVIRKYELEMVREMVLEHIESILEDDPAKTGSPDAEKPPIV